jgi:hypothetical protein
VVETRGWSITAVVRSLVCGWEEERLVIIIEGDLVVKGVITNYEVTYVPEGGMVAMDALRACGT